MKTGEGEEKEKKRDGEKGENKRWQLKGKRQGGEQGETRERENVKRKIELL